jgi:hypothetical protein
MFEVVSNADLHLRHLPIFVFMLVIEHLSASVDIPSDCVNLI